MTISLDGFVNDRNGNVGRLYPDLEALRKTSSLQQAIKTTGAVVMGRRAYEMADDPDSYAGNYEFQVPIFVLAHKLPKNHPKETDTLKFTFETGNIGGALEKAREAAGDRNVFVVGGASVAQQCLNSGLIDEILLGIMPVLFGEGLKLFERIDAEKMHLEKMKVLESTNGRTEIKLQVIK